RQRCCFLRGAGQRSISPEGEIYRTPVLAASGRRAVNLGAGGAGRGRVVGRVCHHHRHTTALYLRLQAQQVAPASQVSDRVVLDQVFIILVHKSGKRNEVQSSVGR